MQAQPSIIANCTLLCNLKCEHCYCSAGPKNNVSLTLEDFKQVIYDLKNMGIDSPPFFDITGGEFLLLNYASEISELVRSNFPSSSIILESNGLFLINDFKRYENIEFDRLHVSIDVFHSNLDNGERIIDNAIKLCKLKNAKLVINHIPDSSGLSDESCIRKAEQEKIEINYFEFNTLAQIGRGLNLCRTKKGQKVHDNPSFFRCELGEAIFVNPDKNWYICHYPTDSTLIGKIGGSNLHVNYNNFLKSSLYKKLCDKGLPTVYEEFCKKPSDIEKHFYNRCEPCIYLMNKELLNFTQ